MNTDKKKQFIDDIWDSSIIPSLKEYIKIPCKSPSFDKKWQENGYIDEAVELVKDWCDGNAPKGAKIENIRKDGKTPLLYIDIPGEGDQTILLYGHLDKQPEMVGWDEDLGPFMPKLKGDHLYGRGAADDGYSIYTIIAAINMIQKAKLKHQRLVVLIETCEESGSFDFGFYLDYLKDRIKIPDLIVCLDSGCGDYNRLWVTTSLRGSISGSLTVKVLNEGVHSGIAGGIIPTCYRIASMLLKRIEDPETGEVILPELKVEIPSARKEQMKKTIEILGDKVYQSFPFYDNCKPLDNDNLHLLENKTWKACLAVVGCEGLPTLQDAGNVLLPEIKLKLSLRFPPGLDQDVVAKLLKKTLEENPPYNAHVKYSVEEKASGWHAPIEPQWFKDALQEASKEYFDNSARYVGEGASIPLMNMLSSKFPNAKFLITGVLGPKSNAHGPNEFLHIPMVKKLTGVIAHIISKHYQNSTQ